MQARRCANMVSDPDPALIISELKIFQGGVADTSTLIYMEGIELLELCSRTFRLLVIPEVIAEFGRPLPECTLCGGGSIGNADRSVVRLALERGVPVLSEDKALLMSADRLGLPYYNSLMIVLALLFQKKLGLDAYHRAYNELVGIARYSPAVLQVGRQVFSLFAR